MTNGQMNLKEELQAIVKQGIISDAQQLKKDNCSQFADQNEWIREYVVNAYDAGARYCHIYGEETETTIKIYIIDDGHGMNKKGIQGLFTLYKSIKQDCQRATIGTHGIGVISVAAIPEQQSLSVFTSTGNEAWCAKAGNLLSNDSIKIEQVKQIPEAGTEFCIEFKKTKSLGEVMKKLYGVLETYLKYLPFEISVCLPYSVKGENMHTHIASVCGNWEMCIDDFGKMYEFKLDGYRFELVMSLKSGRHEVYQNRVYITNKYNLLDHDIVDNWYIPFLEIRVDSPDFDLPFGRHCLRNEEILYSLSSKIRKEILPNFYSTVAEHYQSEETRSSVREIEDLTLALCKNENHKYCPWTSLPIFKLINNKRLSLDELRDEVFTKKKIYFTENGNAGMDYSFFDAPVINPDQMDGKINFLKSFFSDESINLSSTDLVIEAPIGMSPKLSDLEKLFQDSLTLHPKALRKTKQSNINIDFDIIPEGDKERSKKTYNELKNATKDVDNIVWKVNYLVQRDGISPSKSHKFIINKNTVILNLNHPEIRKLVQLTKTAPELAGHWAIAMCLTENQKIFPDLSPETREDLLLMDAISKLNNKSKDNLPQNYKTRFRNKNEKKDDFWDFFRNASF